MTDSSRGDGSETEGDAFVRSLLAHDADDLDATNDLEYLLGLIGEAIKYEDEFDGDRELAQWAVAQWCQEVGYQPDLSEYATGQTVPRGTVPPHLEGYQNTLVEAGRDV